MQIPRRRAASLAAGVVVALLLAEGALRLAGTAAGLDPEARRAGSLPLVPAVFSGQVLRSGAAHDVPSPYGGTWHVNSAGYRGPEFAREKPPGAIRVIVYGGSSVFDLRNPGDDDWPRRVERLLRERGMTNVEVVNGGVPATDSSDAVGRLFAEGHLFAPDVVVLYGIWNDLGAFSTERPLLRHAEGLTRDDDPRVTYRGSLDAALCASHVYLCGRELVLRMTHGTSLEAPRGDASLAERPSVTGPRQFELALRAFCRVADAAGARPVLVKEARLVADDNGPDERARINYARPKLTHEALCESFRIADATIDRVGAEERAAVIDAAAPLRGHADWFADHVHTLPDGSAAVARAVADGLEPILRAPR